MGLYWIRVWDCWERDGYGERWENFESREREWSEDRESREEKMKWGE